MKNVKDGLTRGDYAYFMTVPTRWNDNDMLGHVNNVVYYSYFEAVVVQFVMREMGLDWHGWQNIPYAVETRCRFWRPIAYPVLVEAGLVIEDLGSSSVTYGVALFAEGDDRPAATGHFVHVWVDRDSERPIVIDDALRDVYRRYLKKS
ncbi:MAG: acyl-CoA thioesterase [Hyphomicrobiales bacterium]|nr:acyl-CoA thioesterase [Hyphomicrobiales bacterium]